MRRATLLLTLAGCALAAPLQTAATPVAEQAPPFALRTAVTALEVKNFYRDVSKSQARPRLRQSLEPRARAGDPVAQFLYGRSFDPYYSRDPKPSASDLQTAVLWLTRSASQNYAVAEAFLAEAYDYSHMGLPRKPDLASSYLKRAYLHSAGPLRAELALELARQTAPDTDPANRLPGFPSSAAQSRAYVEEALRLVPGEPVANDWLFDLALKNQEYPLALRLANQSQNPTVWSAMGFQLIEGQPPKLSRDPQQGLKLVRRALEKEAADQGETWNLVMTLYALECEKKLPHALIADLYQGSYAGYAESYRTWTDKQGCRVPPGG